jgi:hypothetical protein
MLRKGGVRHGERQPANCAAPPARRCDGGDHRPHDLLAVGSGWSQALANSPPYPPVVTEPAADGQIVSPSDVHMATAPFADPDPGDSHLCSDWDIWAASPAERVWAMACLGGVSRVHVHLGDGTFENSFAGRQDLLPDSDYRLRVRFHDDSGDPATEASPWSERLFQTGPASVIFPLQLDDIASSPLPDWSDDVGELILPQASSPPALRLASPSGDLLLEFRGRDGVSNMLIEPQPLAQHVAVRVELSAGSANLALPVSQVTFADETGMACAPCEVCDPAAGACVARPRAGCRVPTEPRKALLQMKNTSPDTADTVLWRWTKGAATPLPDFGNPTTTENYAFCVYDDSAAQPNLRFRAQAPAGGTCGQRRAGSRKRGSRFPVPRPGTDAGRARDDAPAGRRRGARRGRREGEGRKSLESARGATDAAARSSLDGAAQC